MLFLKRVKTLINHPDVSEKDIQLLKSYFKKLIKNFKKYVFIFKKVVVLNDDMVKNLYHYNI